MHAMFTKKTQHLPMLTARSADTLGRLAQALRQRYSITWDRPRLIQPLEKSTWEDLDEDEHREPLTRATFGGKSVIVPEMVVIETTSPNVAPADAHDLDYV